MAETIHLGEIAIAVTRKKIKHVHLSVYPPGRPRHAGRTDGHPLGGGPRLRSLQARLDPRTADEAASSGEGNTAPVHRAREPLPLGKALSALGQGAGCEAFGSAQSPRITLTVRPGTSRAKRQAIMHEWHKSLLHDVVPGLIRKWQPKLGVEVAGYFLQRMKTKWGSCNHRARHIRLNTELVKKPKDLLEYVVVHEMLHLIAPTHSEQFLTLMTKHYPSWREATGGTERAAASGGGMGVSSAVARMAQRDDGVEVNSSAPVSRQMATSRVIVPSKRPWREVVAVLDRPAHLIKDNMARPTCHHSRPRG